MSELNKRMKNNMKEEDSDEEESKNNDENIKKLYKSIKTINDRFKSDLCPLDRNLIEKIKKLQIEEFKEIQQLTKKIKQSTKETHLNNTINEDILKRLITIKSF